MHGYRLTKAMDLSKFVHSSFPALDGPPAVPETYMVSKELVAYLETLVAFTPYYRADDARMSGKMETFYTKALRRYNTFTYKDFHKYITRKLIEFYNRFDPAESKEEPGELKEGDVVEVGDLPEGAVHQPAFDLSGSSDEEPADVPAHAPSSAGPAVAANEDGAAASPGAAPAAPGSE
jgi:hypothetical protein